MSGYEFKVVKVDRASVEQDLNILGKQGFRVVLVRELEEGLLWFLMERYLPTVF